MKRVKNFHRKRPHILPPLTKLEPSTLHPMDPLQPPDLLLSGNRLGSPAPRRTVPIESDDIFIPNHGKPIIKIFEPCTKGSEKCSRKTDLIPDDVSREEKNSTNQINNTFLSSCGISSTKCVGENVFMKNYTKEETEHLCDGLDKQLKTQEISFLNETENLKSFEFKVLQIPNRYKPLKPIGQITES